jgi:hypothetical protein
VLQHLGNKLVKEMKNQVKNYTSKIKIIIKNIKQFLSKSGLEPLTI